MQSREESLREVEKLVQHTETLERKYTDKVIPTYAVRDYWTTEIMVLIN